MEKSYSQSKEDLIMDSYFGSNIGTLLSIGENNGVDLSNAFLLIQKGWASCLIEPSPQVFPKLKELHKGNDKVVCYQLAIGDENKKVTLYDSGELLGTGDKALVSTVSKEETKRWESLNMPFNEVEVDMVTFDSFLKISPYKHFDLISIDCEGFDLIVLKQMNLKELYCKMIIIEWNGKYFEEYDNYITQFGLKFIHKNAENLIYGLL